MLLSHRERPHFIFHTDINII